ncbi:uncharacterized protein MONBRDRAFT_38239 [Monosiga brevicollis MX1]|uniref:RNA helicase n=1 Tax=Monosiga brevicollis TaxID=81824 RepID=A9V6N1_MONBE|nr:uncharacterized protein MONBRDRAFT_38239 [Monosiga brevicollis MX1]EDQ86762.1 predicted protein [Monosiga brevicollis MX1]|eukprot:XP_001748307.1 hypothetical protein [Monosiga brevicollis MX1]
MAAPSAGMGMGMGSAWLCLRGQTWRKCVNAAALKNNSTRSSGVGQQRRSSSHVLRTAASAAPSRAVALWRRRLDLRSDLSSLSAGQQQQPQQQKRTILNRTGAVAWPARRWHSSSARLESSEPDELAAFTRTAMEPSDVTAALVAKEDRAESGSSEPSHFEGDGLQASEAQSRPPPHAKGFGIQLHNAMHSALARLGIHRATDVQRRAVSKIAEGVDVLITSETGTGKTLAYLLPALARVIANDFRAHQVLILVPTRELAVQVYQLTHELLKDVRGIKAGKAINCLARGLLGENKQLSERHPFLQEIDMCILDEVDHLLDPLSSTASQRQKMRRQKHPRPASQVLDRVYFGREVKYTEERDDLEPLRRTVQLVGASATLGQRVKRELRHKRWTRSYEMVKCSEKMLAMPTSIVHTVMSRYDMEQVGRSFGPNMSAEAVEAAQAMPSSNELLEDVLAVLRSARPASALLFVPTSVPIADVVAMIASQAVDPSRPDSALRFSAVALYAHVHLVKPTEAEQGRQILLQRVAAATPDAPLIVVANMDAVRGLDLPGVELGLLVGTPRDSVDYLHIAGRVGRNQRRGVVTTIAYNLHQGARIQRLAKQLDLKLLHMRIDENALPQA